MLTSTRCSDDPIRNTNEISKACGDTILPDPHKSPTTCDGGEKLIESLPPGSGSTVSSGLGSSRGSDQDVWDGLSSTVSKMARNFVSLFLSDGDTILYTCSGIPVERNLPYTRILTSANLAVAMRSKRKLGSTIGIKVHDAFNNVAPGCLEHCELEHGTAFVRVVWFLDVSVVNLHHGVEFCPHSDLLAIQLTDSGVVAMPVKGVLTKDSSAFEHNEVLCKAGDGGPLFDGDGKFVGMNLFSDKGICVFVERSAIVDRIEQLQKWKELRARRARELIRPRFGDTDERRLRQVEYVLL